MLAYGCSTAKIESPSIVVHSTRRRASITATPKLLRSHGRQGQRCVWSSPHRVATVRRLVPPKKHAIHLSSASTCNVGIAAAGKSLAVFDNRCCGPTCMFAHGALPAALRRRRRVHHGPARFIGVWQQESGKGPLKPPSADIAVVENCAGFCMRRRLPKHGSCGAGRRIMNKTRRCQRWRTRERAASD